MPLYEYTCRACGKSAEKLEKISAPPLQDCPYCGAPEFDRQVSNTHFQLKGDGWYATDFRDKGKPKSESKETTADTSKPAVDKKSDKKTDPKDAE